MYTWDQAYNAALTHAQSDSRFNFDDARDFAMDYADVWSASPRPQSPRQFVREYI